MKTKVLIALLAFGLAGCSNDSSTENNAQGPERIDPALVNNPATASGNDTDADLPAFEFAETTFDFGSLTSGATVTHEYRFKNTGSTDLLIAEAHGSCGCTVPEYPKTPVAPGDEGVIKVTFNSAGMSGQIAKTITILANTIPSTKVLTISGEVIK
jgi:hypothetical protein